MSSLGFGIGGPSKEAIERLLNRDKSKAVRTEGLDFSSSGKTPAKVVITGAKGTVAVVRTPSNGTTKIVDRSAFAAALKKNFEHSISLTEFIPVDLLNSIGKGFSENLIKSEPMDLRSAYKSRDGYAETSAHIVGLITNIQNAYHAHYIGLLSAMDGLIRDPGVPAAVKQYHKVTGANGKETLQHTNTQVSFDKSVSFKPHIPVSGVKQASVKPLPMTTIQLKGVWPALTSGTVNAKKALGKKAVFWNHTGEASRAFRAAVNSRRAFIKPKHFIDSAPVTPRLIGGSASGGKRPGAGKYVAKATFTFKVGIPHWNKKMDTLITIPFATQKTNVSTLKGTGLNNKALDGASNWQSTSRVNGPDLRGIDRLLVAEAYRPWLRDLSAQAGNALQRYVTNGRAATLARHSPLAQELHKKAQDILKQVKETTRLEREAAAKLSPKGKRKTEKLRRAALTPGQRKAEDRSTKQAMDEKNATVRVERAARSKLQRAELAAGKLRAKNEKKGESFADFQHKSTNTQFSKIEKTVAAMALTARSKPPTRAKAAAPKRAAEQYISLKTKKPVSKRTYDKHNSELFKEAETSFNTRAASMVKAGDVKGITALLATHDGISASGKAEFITLAKNSRKK